jgi:hypothetical protein
MHNSNLETFSKQKLLFQGLSSKEALLACKGIHEGRRAFIIGNGPSLKTRDLDRLQNEVTFAANRIHLAYEQTNWRPTYWCCSDKIQAKAHLAEFAALESLKFGAFSVEESLKGLPFTYIVDRSRVVPGRKTPVAGMDLVDGVHPGVSVVIFMLKLARWMGIRAIYLIGLDFSFTVPSGAETGEKEFGNSVILSKGEVNHFHPAYRSVGDKWTMPQLDGQKSEFRAMKWRLNHEGIVVQNASRSSKLAVFERVDFDDLMLAMDVQN